jgi:hypothetical protein
VSRQRLDLGVVFDASGHLEEVAIVILADGQGSLPDEASAHLETCDACCGKLAESALASVQVGELLRDARPARSAVAIEVATPATPWSVVGLAFVLSLAGLAPSIGRLPTAVSRAVPVLAHMGPVLARGLSTALGARGQTALVSSGATLASATLLIVFGFTVSRWFRHEGAAS